MATNQSFSARIRNSASIQSISAFFGDQGGSSARSMVLASIAAAALIGFGVGAAAFSTTSTVQTASIVSPVNDDLAGALAAALTAPAEQEDEVISTQAASITIDPAPARADVAALEMTPTPVSAPASITIVNAFDNVLQGTNNPTAAVYHTADAWVAPLQTRWDAINLAARENGIVNAFDTVLPDYEEAVVVVRSGDTMMNLLTDLGIDRRAAYNAIEAFGEVFDPRRLRVGYEFNVAYEEALPIEEGSAEDAFHLLNLSLRTAPDQEVTVRWDDESQSYVSETREIALEERFTQARGTIDSSLYLSANELGVPDAATIGMIRVFSHSVDFLREIRAGDEFEIFYSQRFDEDGEPVMNGDLLYASLTMRGETEALYRFTTDDDGLTDYYNQDGESVRAFLMRTPIDGARITSSYGPRHHPVLGYNRMHKGTDFGAPTGTPIYAAGAGTVVRASAYGSYGNYVRIRHVNGYETAYAHLNGYGPGIRSGTRVEQGQVIGYVGATGRVTGAHLHYEVLLNGEQVNPMTIDLPSGRQLEGDILTAFNERRAEIDAMRSTAPQLAVTATASAGGLITTGGPDLSQE